VVWKIKTHFRGPSWFTIGIVTNENEILTKLPTEISAFEKSNFRKNIDGVAAAAALRQKTASNIFLIRESERDFG